MAESGISSRNGAITISGFVRLLAHELGNPVATIRMSAEMLAGGTPEELQEQLLEIILAESGRLESLIESAVYYTSIPSSELQEIELDSLVASIAHQLESSTHVTFDNSSGLEMIMADAGQLARILRELLTNAVESGATNIKLSVESEGDMVIFSVHDDGEGVPVDKLSVIFDPFYTTREGQLGLGLSIARRIAELHGGSITVNATTSSGTIVELRIPKQLQSRS